MKLNWGTAIVLAFAAFITFILAFVFFVGTDIRADHSLVADDYYNQELQYQDEIDGEINAIEAGLVPKVNKTEAGLQITFPEAMYDMDSKGVVYFYRPSNRKLDFKKPLLLNNSGMLIPKNNLVAGRWNIKIAWQSDGISYLFKENLTF